MNAPYLRLLKLFEDQGAVGATKSKRIGHCNLDIRS